MYTGQQAKEREKKTKYDKSIFTLKHRAGLSMFSVLKKKLKKKMNHTGTLSFRFKIKHKK